METIQIKIVDAMGREIKLLVDLNETIGSAKKRYADQLYTHIPHMNTKIMTSWCCNGDILEDNEIFSDAGIEGGDTIVSSQNYNGVGDAPFGISMADISNKKGLVEGNFNNNAKDWNKVITGLNVSGICNNYGCQAYKKLVDCQIGVGTFDLVRDADRIKCPMCNEEIEPTTCCFSKCQYKFEGKKKSNGKTEYVNSEWKRVEKDYEYYDPKKSGNVNWLMLIIDTKRL